MQETKNIADKTWLSANALEVLSPIRLSDKPVFDLAYSQIKNPISDYTFAITFIWGKVLLGSWAIIHNHLCVFIKRDGSLIMLLPPIPMNSDDADKYDFYLSLNYCFALMNKYNEYFSDISETRIEYVAAEFIHLFTHAPSANFEINPMPNDYIYSIKDMIELAGTKFKNKRHARNKFIRDFPNYRTEKLNHHHREACLSLLDIWNQKQRTDEVLNHKVMRDMEVRVTKYVLEYYENLNLTGLVLFVEDNLIGFTLGESLSPKQISIVIEKTHPDYPGSAQFIFSEFCRQYWSDYPECNVGDDEGVPSLRFTKESYRSIRMLEKYVVKQKSKFSPDDFSNIPTSLNVDIPVIRKAKNEDVDAILQIEEISFDSQQEKFNRRQIRNLICNHRAIVSVIVVNEEVIGWAVCLIRQYDKYKTGRLYAIAISPGARRKKMGQKLLEHCINSLSSLGIFSISLEVRNNNEPAISLYRKMNFKDQAVLPDYYGLGKDGLRMKLLLTGV